MVWSRFLLMIASLDDATMAARIELAFLPMRACSIA